MKSSCVIIATGRGEGGGDNDQGLQKMNPIKVRLVDINHHKVVTKFYVSIEVVNSSWYFYHSECHP